MRKARPDGSYLWSQMSCGRMSSVTSRQRSRRMASEQKLLPRKDFRARRQARSKATFHREMAAQSHGDNCEAVEAWTAGSCKDRSKLGLLTAIIT